MILTSNSITHDYKIQQLTLVGEVDGFENVAKKVEILVNSSTTFTHTHEMIIENESSMVGIATTVTEEKTVNHVGGYSVTLSTTGIGTTSFTTWEDLEEDQVLQWCFDRDPVITNQVRETQETLVLKEKDKIINPRKYYTDTPVLPWEVRKSQEILA